MGSLFFADAADLDHSLYYLPAPIYLGSQNAFYVGLVHADGYAGLIYRFGFNMTCHHTRF